MDEVQRTFIDTNNGWGGNAWGAGLGAFVGSMFGNNGWGWGGNNRSAGIGYDTGAINAIQEQLGNVQTQIANADRDLLMQTSSQNQFVGNLVNNTGDAIVGAITSGNQTTQNAINNLGQNVQNGIFQNTLTQVQSQGQTNLAMCQGFGGLGSSIDRGIGLLNQNISDQGAQSRLQAQELASQQQACCCQVLRAIEQEGCANRELQREIQYQNTRDQLANKNAEVEALKAQLFTTNLVSAQTSTLINALKPTTTTGA